MAFTLDDVRESFTSDITRFLGEIEKGSKAVVSAATLTVPPERTWQLPINSMVVGLHGIVGSSSLVGVNSLAQPARRLEDIATLASESVRMLRVHAARLKLIAGVCAEGSSDLRVILEHELAGRGPEAEARRAQLDKRLELATSEISDQLDPSAAPERIEHEHSKPHSISIPVHVGPSASGPTKIPPLPPKPAIPAPAAAAPKAVVPKPALTVPAAPAAASSSDPDDGWEDTVVGVAMPARAPASTASAAPSAPQTTQPTAPTAAQAAISAADDELALVFQAEAREALTNLRGYLTRLEQQTNDREAATQCARLFHLLKGAAASVGLTEIAGQAQELHATVEKMKAAGLDPQAVARLRTETEKLIAFAVPDLAASAAPGPAATTAAAPTAAQTAADTEPAAIFREEAQGALAEIRGLLKNVRETAGTARGVMTGRIERLLHRLKGSALIVGLAQVAAVASRGQSLCEALDRVDPIALTNVVEQLATMVTPPPVAAEPRGPTTVKISLPQRDEWEGYLEESSEILDGVDKILGLLEGSARPAAELSNLFRSYHTLKGASNAVGLTPVGQHLHIIETFLERIVAAPRIEDLRSIVRALAEQNTVIRRNVARASTEAEVEVDHDRVQAVFAALGHERGSGASWISPGDSAWSAEQPGLDRPKRARTRTRDRSSQHDSRAEASEHESRGESAAESTGESKGESEARHDTEVPAAERRFIRVPADRLDNLLDLAGELVVCRSRMLSRVNRIQRLQEDDLVRYETVIQLVDGFASSTQFTNLDGRRRAAGTVTSLAASGPAPTASASGMGGFGALELDQYEEIHVLSRRLDEAASDISEVRREIGTEMESLTEAAEMLSTIASGLQSEITRARMLTVDSLFTRLRLPIRDAAQRGEREIQIVTAGEQLAIDKAMSDAMYGPLLHLVRNAVAHGIEAPAAREAAGKPRAGTIRLVATQIHGEIVLEITDDGKGVDLARLREVGVKRGLIPAGVELSDPRVTDLIFAKGVSTHADVDEVAGRGLGGNVVKRAVDRLNGTIQVSSQAGVGTMFRISLPLSMSITQAILVRVGGVLLAIPIAYAETIMATDSVEIVDSFGRQRARIGERMIPVHQARRTFEERMLRSAPTDKVIVVCVVGGEKIAIQVDEVIGQEEIVVKSLGMLLEGHPLFTGSTSRGDGELALILDIPGVLESESQGERRRPIAAPMGMLPVAVTAEAQPGPQPQAQTEPAAPSREAAPQAELLTELSGGAEAVSRAAVVKATAGIELGEIVAVPTGRLRVLFVDDSLSVRKVAERMLASLDVDVVTAVDGLDALDKLRAMGFSLVFTDLEMPRMHGFELIREMQLLPAYQAIPVVVISSRSGQKHIDQALSMGAREYLTKPFSPEILGAVLGRLAKRGA